MTRILAISLLIVFSASAALGQEGSRYAGDFLQIPVGSRAMSMGAAFTGIANDASAFHWNPAGVSLLKGKTVGFMYSSEYGAPGSSLASFWHLGFTYPMSELSVGLNWVRLSVGDLEHTPDLTGINVTAKREELVRQIASGPKDLFTDAEDAIVLSVARNNKFTIDWGWLYYDQKVELPVGINFKIINQKVGRFGQGSGIGIDLGGMLKFSVGQFILIPEVGDLSLGMTVSDLFGTRLNWSTQRQQVIPTRVKAGAGYMQEIPALNLRATFAADYTLQQREKARFGVDMTYQDQISIRAGMHEGYFTTGAGFNWERTFTLDYSLQLHTALGAQHRLSFALDIDKLLQKQGTPEDAK